MTGYVAEQEASWYDITVAGKRFTIASRYGEDHIREVERLLNSTFGEVSARVPGQPILNLALLTALNLADQLLSQQSDRAGESEQFSKRVEGLLTQLESTLNGSLGETHDHVGLGTPAVFD